MSGIGPARAALTAMRRIFKTEGDGACLIITISPRNQTRASTRRLGSRMGHYGRACLIGLVGVVPTVAWRARAEEAQLRRTFGERYALDRRQTKMIIPASFLAAGHDASTIVTDLLGGEVWENNPSRRMISRLNPTMVGTRRKSPDSSAVKHRVSRCRTHGRCDSGTESYAHCDL
jgi:hypothetical protein